MNTLFGQDHKPHDGDPMMCETQPDFDGKTFDQKRDGKRLLTQQKAVERLMQDGYWRTDEEVQAGIRKVYGVVGKLPSVSARVRDLRKPKHGGYEIARRHRAGAPSGVNEYRMVLGGSK